MRRFLTKSVQSLKSFWRSSPIRFPFALFHGLLTELHFQLHETVGKHKALNKFSSVNIQGCLKLPPYLQQYRDILLNFGHHFLFGVPSKIV